MSAAATGAKRLEHRTNESTRQAETGVPGKLEARPVIEDHGITPLMRAACDGSAGTVQALLDRGAEVNAKRADGFNALALAAFFGHAQVVWLLLENGADLTATGRSETLPEMWADVRGFVDIGDMLREARETKQLEASTLRPPVIDEPVPFTRPAEKEKLQRADSPVPDVEVQLIDEATDSESTLTMVPAPVVEESTARRSQSTANILPSDKAEPAQQQPVIEPSPRVSKTLPEIQDPPRLVVPEFHPGSVFVSRITSSRKNLVALILAMLLACIGMAAFLFPQIRKSLADLRKAAVTNSTNLATEPSNPVAGSGTSVSGIVETPSAAPTESTTAPATKDIEETAADTTTDSPAASEGVESSSRVRSAEGSEKGSAGIAAAKGSESRAHSRSSTFAGDRVPEARENKGELAATSLSRSAAPARKQRAVSRAVKFKQQTVAEEPPKPAPLSVEMSRSRSVLSTPARSADEVPGSQPPPLNIISGKPKSKVIQWP